LEGGDLSELRADDLDDSVMTAQEEEEEQEVDESPNADTASVAPTHFVSNLSEQMSRATSSAMKARQNDSDDSVVYEEMAHPALQMAYR
jgi:hypothetical protein